MTTDSAAAIETVVRVYKYGARAPELNGTLVREQLWLAHRYRNTLVEIERGRRTAVRAAIAELPTVAAVESVARDAHAQMLRTWKLLADARAITRSRAGVDAVTQQAYLDAKKSYYESMTKLGSARKLALKELVGFCDVIHDRAGELGRSAREHSRLYWGTYLIIEAQVDAAKKMPLWDELEASDPHFERWTGEGQVGVQLQNGLAAAKIWGGDMRVRIVPLDPRAWSKAGRVERRLEGATTNPWITTLALRVGSDSKKKPVWAECHVMMDRPLPEGSVIKWVKLSVRKIGPHEEWSVEITLSMPRVVAPMPESPRSVGVDLGWRKIDGDLRVGTWCNSDGERAEIRVDERLISRFRKVEDLRSIRDKSFNAVRAVFAEWLETAIVPDWMKTATSHIAQWHASSRLAALAIQWRDRRFDGDTEALAAVESWRKQDKHLWTWESAQRINTLRARKHVFREAAAYLAKTHDILVLEDIDLRTLARLAPAESVESDNASARGNRHLVSPSELRESLINAFTSRGKPVKYVHAAWTTRTCHACGSVETWDAAKKLAHQCGHCGARWDQDDNAAKNLLVSYCERPDAATSTRIARSKRKPQDDQASESKWTRARRAAAEREVRTGTDRNASSK